MVDILQRATDAKIDDEAIAFLAVTVSKSPPLPPPRVPSQRPRNRRSYCRSCISSQAYAKGLVRVLAIDCVRLMMFR